ncbi:hypothetical protein [Synechocystis salina]|nr:hypothetical protein [Synechocystis salina]
MGKTPKKERGHRSGGQKTTPVGDKERSENKCPSAVIWRSLFTD